MAAAKAVKACREKRRMDAFEEIFRKVDHNCSGFITMEEYLAMFNDHGVSLTKSETSQLVRLAGENGKLRKVDFVELVKNSRTFSKTFDKNKDSIVTEAEMTTRCEIAFKALDMNNTGYVTAKHIKKLTPKLSQAERDGLMAKLDSDGDGQLCYAEFQKLFIKTSPSAKKK
eukprot:TRINITY_DN47057_c0_g1_i1.p1 TRINITY_DN47057_c0_g1~~TRINITY_DN47057_c0_g1_i1.p1  ORF type:complete len:171 (-),score=61.80 TRINITY_DN47057_c0_g1_i1:91-603(-)